MEKVAKTQLKYETRQFSKRKLYLARIKYFLFENFVEILFYFLANFTSLSVEKYQQEEEEEEGGTFSRVTYRH